MAKVKVKIEGLKEVKEEFNKFKLSGDNAIDDFLTLISENALRLLKANTPVDTGELQNSWQELNRDDRSVELGVSDDQEDKLQYVIKGTKYIPPNDFITPIDTSINQLIQTYMSSALKRAHKFWRQVPDTPGSANITSTVGLTGTKFNSRRSFGRASLYRLRTGRKRLNRRLGRRRRVGSSILKKTAVG